MIVPTRQGLSERAHSDGVDAFFYRVLECCAVALRGKIELRRAAPLVTIASKKLRMLFVRRCIPESWNVDSVGTLRLVGIGANLHFGEVTRSAAARYMVH